MGIVCNVKVTNLRDAAIIVCDKLIPPHTFAYFDKDSLVEDTKVYQWQELGYVDIQDMSADNQASLDLPDELDGYKHNIYNDDNILIGKKIWYDAAKQHLWYEMTTTLTADNLPDVITEHFYYYDGSLMFTRKKQYIYDPNTGMLVDEIPLT